MIAALIDGAIKRRKVVLGVTLIACLFGLGAYLSMPREAQPDIDLPPDLFGAKEGAECVCAADAVSIHRQQDVASP